MVAGLVTAYGKMSGRLKSGNNSGLRNLDMAYMKVKSEAKRKNRFSTYTSDAKCVEFFLTLSNSDTNYPELARPHKLRAQS